MANILDSKRLEISELRKTKLLAEGGHVILTANVLFTNFQRPAENITIVQKNLLKDYLEIGYLIYNAQDLPEKAYYWIQLTKFYMPWGGFRYYFLCPLTTKNGAICNKRVAVLYLPKGEKYYGCRHCYQIKHLTQIYNQNHPIYNEVKRSQIQKRIDELEGTRKIYKGRKTKGQLQLEKWAKELDEHPSRFW